MEEEEFGEQKKSGKEGSSLLLLLPHPSMELDECGILRCRLAVKLLY